MTIGSLTCFNDVSPSWFPPTTAADIVGLIWIVELELEVVVERDIEAVVIVEGIDRSAVGTDAGLGLNVADGIDVVVTEASVRVGASADPPSSRGTERTSPTDSHSPSNLETETSRSDAAVRA